MRLFHSLTLYFFIIICFCCSSFYFFLISFSFSNLCFSSSNLFISSNRLISSISLSFFSLSYFSFSFFYFCCLMSCFISKLETTAFNSSISLFMWFSIWVFKLKIYLSVETFSSDCSKLWLCKACLIFMIYWSSLLYSSCCWFWSSWIFSSIVAMVELKTLSFAFLSYSLILSCILLTFSSSFRLSPILDYY